jgi:NAD(P)H-dependent flavin oxidoreductase YrpB (nitropropane dioxygenase family)|tara:strand:- start:299 stop:1447 length:1149 start_codon:yes stop_codon:yes gene_type:complete
MNSKLCKDLGIEFPLFAFSHCRDVVAAVTKAGGMGVLGATNLSGEELEIELNWIDSQVNGLPYGVDLIVPNNFVGKGEDLTDEQMLEKIPQSHKDFANSILEKHGIKVDPDELESDRVNHLRFGKNMTPEGASESLRVAFNHPIKMIVNALGMPPKEMVDMAKERNVLVGALVGAKKHAINQVNAGVDVLIVAGGEAGGHCGEVSTMVLIPEVYNAVKDMKNVSILAAGGIATGSQMAAAMAMGAAGAWCGSVWLTTTEAETNPIVKEKMIAASSADTVRSKSRTGKYSRQLRSPWTDEWENSDQVQPLPSPVQPLVAEPALRKLDKLSQAGNQKAIELSTYWVGQCVGLMNEVKSAGEVVQDFKEDFIEAYDRLNTTLEDV